MADLNDAELKEVLEFLTRWAPDHPELGEGDIIRWQRGFHFFSRSKGRLIGFIMQLPHIFRYGERSGRSGEEQIGWGVTLVVESGPDSGMIRSAATLELLKKVEKNIPWQFAAVGVVPEIEETYTKRGHVVRRDSSMMYARFFRPHPALKYMNKSTFLAPALKTGNLLFPPRRKVDMSKLTRIDRFDSAWDAKWDSLLAERYELYGVRDAAFLNYKLEQPGKEYQVYTHQDDGYIIFRYARHRTRDMKLVKICDLVASEQARPDLLAAAMNYALTTDAYGITALGAVTDKADFRRAGLFIARPYVVTVPPHITAEMHISFFDSDLDNLW